MALEKEVRIEELNSSGSKAIKSIDPYGRHNYYAEQMKESNGSMDGEISGKLRRPKYDEEQLLLAVDTEVDELIPSKPKDLPDVVLKEEYDALQRDVNRLNDIIADLRAQLASGASKIQELEAQIAGLRAELDGALLRVAVAENSAEASADKFAQTSIDLQQAIQKSVAEAIERVSLEAQVEGLTAQKEALVNQVSSLESQVAGVQSQLQAGGESAGGVFTARIAPEGEDDKPDIYFYSTKRKKGGKGWINGPELILLNSSEEPLTFNFTNTASWLKTPNSVTVQSGEQKKLTLVSKRKATDNGDKKKDYTGQLTIKAGTETLSFQALNRNHLGKNKIICEELFRQGYLPFEYYIADERWGDMMFVKDPRLVVGYMMWARHIVDLMKKYPMVTGIFYHTLSKYWCAWMADQMGVKVKQKHIWIGKLIHNIFGYGLSYFVYDNFGGERRYRILKYLEARNGN